MTENCFSSESFFLCVKWFVCIQETGGRGTSPPPCPSGKQQLNASRVFFSYRFHIIERQTPELYFFIIYCRVESSRGGKTERRDR